MSNNVKKANNSGLKIVIIVVCIVCAVPLIILAVLAYLLLNNPNAVKEWLESITDGSSATEYEIESDTGNALDNIRHAIEKAKRGESTSINRKDCEWVKYQFESIDKSFMFDNFCDASEARLNYIENSTGTNSFFFEKEHQCLEIEFNKQLTRYLYIDADEVAKCSIEMYPITLEGEGYGDIEESPIEKYLQKG
jgi:hypothetical protein